MLLKHKKAYLNVIIAIKLVYNILEMPFILYELKIRL